MSYITRVENHGTIVLVVLNDRPQPVVFDHRMFRHMAEAREGDLRGECSLEDSEDGPMLVFEDEDDAY